jgi:hypothetical protein
MMQGRYNEDEIAGLATAERELIEVLKLVQ